LKPYDPGVRSPDAQRLAAGLREVASEMGERIPAPAGAALELGAVLRRLSREPPDPEHMQALCSQRPTRLRAICSPAARDARSAR
jgi:hypothetical protein